MAVQVGDTVGSYARPNETFTVLEIGMKNRMVKVRTSDGQEVWIGMTLIKPLAQDPVLD